MRQRWRVLGTAALGFMAAQGFGRFGFALILPSMRDGLALTNGDMGLIAGAGLGAYLLTAAPAGAVAARFGRRWLVSAGLVLTAAGLAVTGAADGLGAALLGQCLAGLAAPLAVIPLLSAGPSWFPSVWRGRATGLVVAGGGVGILCTGFLAPLLMSLGGAQGWRTAWWGLASLIFAIAAVCAALLRDPPTVETSARGLGIQSVYRHTAVWRISLAFGLYGVSYINYGTFFAAQLTARGVAPTTSGQLWSLVGLFGISSGFVGGILADRIGPATALLVMFAGQATALAALALGDSMSWFAASAVLYGLSMWGFPSAVSKACAEEVGPRLATAALGLAGLMFGVGQAAGPAVGGWATDSLTTLWPGAALAPALLFGSLAALAGMIVAQTIRRPARPH
ncbi:MAG: YbfB/YjiJ family MFS transporter [Chloroflexota bacterium]